VTEKNKTGGFSHNRILSFLFIALALAVAGCNANVNLGDNANELENKANTPAAYQTKLTGSLQNGDVAIELTPIGMKNGRFEVQITANTHSVDLSQFDLMEITTLAYENKDIKPLSSPKLNGHHSSGTMAFDIKKEISSFRIIINDIPNMEKRVFEWP